MSDLATNDTYGECPVHGWVRLPHHYCTAIADAAKTPGGSTTPEDAE